MKLVISAFGPSIEQQCYINGVLPTGMQMLLVERISSAITLCYVQGIITDSERDRAHTRLIKKAKFRKVSEGE